MGVLKWGRAAAGWGLFKVQAKWLSLLSGMLQLCGEEWRANAVVGALFVGGCALGLSVLATGQQTRFAAMAAATAPSGPEGAVAWALFLSVVGVALFIGVTGALLLCSLKKEAAVLKTRSERAEGYAKAAWERDKIDNVLGPRKAVASKGKGRRL